MIRLLLQTVVLALGQIWTNKVRAILAMLMIVIGVAALILIVGGSEGFKASILKEFESVGANKVWVFPRRPPEARDRFSWRQIRMKVPEADGILANCPSIVRLTPVMEFTAEVQYGDRNKPVVQVRGIRPVWHDIEQRSVISGRPFSNIDLEAVRNVCLVNDKAVQELALPDGGPGNHILVGGRRFLIVGVVETKAVSPMFGDNAAQTEVYIPLNTAEVMRPDWGIYVIAQTRDAEQFEDAKAEVTFYMRKARDLKPGDPDTFGVEAIEQYIAQIRRIGTIMTFFLSGLVMVALLVGGVGIMVIQLVSVTERTREIGLRMAIGARGRDILAQFVTEAVVLSSIGGLAGVLGGIGASMIIASAAGWPMLVEADSIVVAVLFSAAIGVFFGFYPARRAAKLDPIEALRYE